MTGQGKNKEHGQAASQFSQYLKQDAMSAVQATTRFRRSGATQTSHGKGSASEITGSTSVATDAASPALMAMPGATGERGECVFDDICRGAALHIFFKKKARTAIFF
jgi:hypothetical protein